MQVQLVVGCLGRCLTGPVGRWKRGRVFVLLLQGKGYLQAAQWDR